MCTADHDAEFIIPDCILGQSPLSSAFIITHAGRMLLHQNQLLGHTRLMKAAEFKNWLPFYNFPLSMHTLEHTRDCRECLISYASLAFGPRHFVFLIGTITPLFPPAVDMTIASTCLSQAYTMLQDLTYTLGKGSGATTSHLFIHAS